MEQQTAVAVHGDVPAAAAREATVRLARAVEQFGTGVEGLRVRLSDAAGPCAGRVLAQANAVAAGRRVRVQVLAGTHRLAVEALLARLRARVAEVAAGWSPRPWPARDGVGAPTLAGACPAAVGGGWIARVKPYSLVWCEVAAAAATMDVMDYGAHLFTDPDTEMDAVVYRAGPTGYRLCRLRPASPPRQERMALVVDARPAPVLNRDQAVARLDKTGLGHLFFADAASGRGSLLYRRFDGRYSLIAGTG